MHLNTKKNSKGSEKAIFPINMSTFTPKISKGSEKAIFPINMSTFTPKISKSNYLCLKQILLIVLLYIDRHISQEEY